MEKTFAEMFVSLACGITPLQESADDPHTGSAFIGPVGGADGLKGSREYRPAFVAGESALGFQSIKDGGGDNSAS
jgi:hypothetical protein